MHLHGGSCNGAEGQCYKKDAQPQPQELPNSSGWTCNARDCTGAKDTCMGNLAERIHDPNLLIVHSDLSSFETGYGKADILNDVCLIPGPVKGNTFDKAAILEC